MSAYEAWSLGVSIVAALGTAGGVWVSLCTARRTQQIELYVHRREAYEAFHSLRQYIQENGSRAKRDVVQRWLVLDRESSHFFDPTLARDMKAYFDKCFRIADLSQVEKTPEEQKEVESLLSEISKLGGEIAGELEARLKVN